MTKIVLKKGDTLSLSCSLKDDISTPIDLATCSITSQVRKVSNQELVSDLEVIVTDEPNGEYSLLKTDTTGWPIEVLQCDIKYVFGTSVIRTETFFIDVKLAVTL